MDITLKILTAVSAITYFISALFHILNKKTPAYVLNGVAFLFNISLVGINWVTNGYVPFISMYQVLTFVSACFTLSYLYMHFVNKEPWTAKYFMLCAGVAMTGAFFMTTSEEWLRVPALQSVWFIPHVLCYMLSYSLSAASFVICLTRLISKSKREDHSVLDKGIYDMVRLSFPFMTAGMLIGAIWANEIWGHFWSWDIKENWAFITWLLYAIFLHCYRNAKARKYMYVFIILGFAALIITLVGINLFGMGGVHSYS